MAALSLSRDFMVGHKVWEAQGWKHSPALAKISPQGYGNYRVTQRHRAGRRITCIFAFNRGTQVLVGAYHSSEAEIGSQVVSLTEVSILPHLALPFLSPFSGTWPTDPFSRRSAWASQHPKHNPLVRTGPRRKQGFSGYLHPLGFPAASWGGFLPSS